MKVAAVVILYRPDEHVISNIKTYYEFVDKIFVFDNTETESTVKDKLLKFSKIDFYHDYDNQGIAKRLNSACNMALQQNFDWILTMDQDSSFVENAFSYYLNCFHQYKGKENVAMFGIKYSREKISSSQTCECNDIEEIITSGMLLNLSSFKKIGDFDESLFIDHVDHDYCIRAKRAGYAIIEFGNIYILHAVGKLVYNSSIKSLFLIRKEKIIHSPLRCYYMYRNMLYLEKKYENYKVQSVKNVRKYVMTHIKVCLLYGRYTLKLIRYLIAAKKDFKMGKLGKIEREL